MLLCISMSTNTTFWELIAGVIIFAAANVAYFVIRGLIEYIKAKSEGAGVSPPRTASHVTLHAFDIK